ncbi:type I-E CRISPR-associated endonuclease Cas1e [Bifidobacterium callitrichos]|uniref:type I-E CRISPR-associated endonuclease Cas1e n=1 Tax=Bifidobacterium callitrichos TaxID=762209 RepID=UPI0021591836|nr:type I-E CRISPR-associated endonuclease Cas1e [Bifidobacterium callitrichos]
MKPVPGSPPPELGELVRAEDRLSFAYFEHCVINRDDNAITVSDVTGTIHVPAATLSVLMLGPGSTVSHQAMTMIGENGATVIWVGERGVRMYAFGKPLTHSAVLLQNQAALVSNTRSRLSVARAMYQIRFPGEDVSRLTMQQLRGREGARVRRVYRECSARTGVEWDKRTYDHDDFDAGTEINKALSAAHTCLYGIAHAVIVALGCSPGLGFVHVGHEKSFVYDIADLYKAELSIPVAFDTAAMKPDDIGSAVRHAMRDAVYDLSIMKRMTRDIRMLFNGDDGGNADSVDADTDHVGLWDGRDGEVAAGVSYGRDEEDEDDVHGDVLMPDLGPGTMGSGGE